MKAELVGLTLLAVNAWPAAETPVQWVKFQDPFEHAFSADVPQGWTAKGGLFRLGYSDARPMIDLVSPDGRINIRFGDVAIPAYSLPNRSHREGEIYDLGAQAQLTVAGYRSGQDYAAAYGPARFKTVCASRSPQPIDQEPPVRANVPDEMQPQKSSNGQTAYLCGSGRDRRTAYVYATTSLYQGFWTVHALASFIAPADRASLARAILLRCSQSFQLNAEWTRYQKRMDQEALDYQRQRQQARLRALTRQVASFGNTLTGITPTIDPFGNTRNVWTGPRNGYWINGTGQVINSDVAPGAGWQPLQPRD